MYFTLDPTKENCSRSYQADQEVILWLENTPNHLFLKKYRSSHNTWLLKIYKSTMANWCCLCSWLMRWENSRWIFINHRNLDIYFSLNRHRKVTSSRLVYCLILNNFWGATWGLGPTLMHKTVSKKLSFKIKQVKFFYILLCTLYYLPVLMTPKGVVVVCTDERWSCGF